MRPFPFNPKFLITSSEVSWVTVIRLIEDAPFWAQLLRPVKKCEAKLRARLTLGTSPETITKQQHLSFTFYRFLRLLSYDHVVRYAIVLRNECCFGQV